MARATTTKGAQRYLGDQRGRTVHDLQQARGACEIEEILDEGRGVRFDPDTLEQARREGYSPCGRCSDSY